MHHHFLPPLRLLMPTLLPTGHCHAPLQAVNDAAERGDGKRPGVTYIVFVTREAVSDLALRALILLARCDCSSTISSIADKTYRADGSVW